MFDNHNKNKILTDLFQAYFDARRNKRNTINALAFEQRFEENIFRLFEEIISGKYTPSRSICFIVNNPVIREIFAANFRDRVIHHLIYNYISPIFEGTFINDSYSCRVGKGTHYGIKRIDKFIRSCSQNYQEDCYILKLDIQGYFMSINRSLLFEKAKNILMAKLHRVDFDLPLVMKLIEKTIYNDSTKNCIVKGKKSDWQGLPKDKSLFTTKYGCGLPIGNLTSQLFGNIYLNALDHFVKRNLKIKNYGRYVDDFILVHKDKEYLKSLIPIIRDYLSKELMLTLHERKIYLQHYSKGVKYLGAVIKPHRIYVANRTKGNFYENIQKQNEIVRDHKPTEEEKDKFISSMNSYLGILQHYKTHKIRKRMLFKHLSAWWWNHVYLSGGIRKFVLSKSMKKFSKI
ncbi:MAG: RNA-directed DNA polymerase [Candidatus Marinimicrobia bacterium]|nr:RNA-directed DNA polymerase [Candidatus Neomarinimicrobiota bacterium]